MNDRSDPPRMNVLPPSGDEDSQIKDLASQPRPARRTSPLKALFVRLPGVTTLVALWLYLLDDEAPDLHRLLLLLMLIYLIWPFDIIGDFVLGPLGFADDLLILGFLIKFIGSENLAPYRNHARRLLRGQE